MENLQSLTMIKNEDILKDLQPKKDFSKLSSPIHEQKLYGFTRRKAKENEICFKQVKLNLNFNDPNNLLAYAYKDFNRFLKSANIKKSDNGKLICIEEIDVSDNVEKFILSVTEDKCVIKAGSTEGVRRALIFIEDEMKRRCGAFLPLGEIVREPFVKTRISRCFFTPPSHCSNDGVENELLDNVDYYPEEYLNRLAHDGINGLWIGTTYRTLLKSKYVKEFGKQQNKQIKKLNSIIKKCKRFGIDIYLFVTEPASTFDNKVLLNYPDMLGPLFRDDIYTICPSSPLTQAYIEEATTNLFKLVPDLAGLISITSGETLSGCGSLVELTCPKCKEKYGTLAKTMTATEKMFSDAIKKVAPKAKFISWTYEHRSCKTSDVIESCRLRDSSVIQMQNFEDFGRPIQLGKKRLAYDYWLSYPGPGELMKTTARYNKECSKTTWAKIQVCSSHEISTVPYVPVPGILYDKYKYMHENGIDGVMQCWYFGNYPSMMNKGASELAYSPFFASKNEFLTHLAKTYFGKDYKKVVKGWKLFEKGYKNFPVSVSFEWFGPMQDSPCCPLHLIPVDHPLPGTWVKHELSGGDRIGECLLNGHNLDEAIILTGKMKDYFNQGLQYISNLPTNNNYVRKEQISNALAIGYIFNSGNNVLKFYKLRHLLGTKQGDALTILKQMETIVKEEIEISKNLIPICEKDSRIGYHTEANGYKIFPEKLKWRISELEKLLKTEFLLVEDNIKNGKLPLEFYYGLAKGYSKIAVQNGNEEPIWNTFTNYNGEKDLNTKLRIYEDNDGCHIQIKVNHNDKIVIKPEFKVMFPTIPLVIENGKFTITPANYYSVPADMVNSEKKKFKFIKTTNGKKRVYTLSFKRETFNMENSEPFRLAVYREGEKGSTLVKATKYYDSQLIRSYFFPEHYCFFVKE